MMIADCPKCQDKVTVPEGVSEQSKVSCPLCREDFELTEIFQELPPLLILLDPPIEESGVSPESTTELPVADDSSTDEVSAEDSDSEVDIITVPGEDVSDSEGTVGQAGAFNFTDTETEEAGTAKPIRKLRQSKSNAENPIVTMIKIGLGGLMAAPLAQLILWWAFAKDPVKLGPKVSPYVPWVVPKSLRGAGSSQVPTNMDRDDWQRLVREESTWCPGRSRVAYLNVVADSDEQPGSTL